MTDITELWLVSCLYSSVAYRFLTFVAILLFCFYVGVFVVSFLVIKHVLQPEHPKGTLLSPQNYFPNSPVTTQDSLYSLLTDEVFASCLTLHLSLHTLPRAQKPGSPLSDVSDNIIFDHKAFYKTLNNSCHYLRRDSFSI